MLWPIQRVAFPIDRTDGVVLEQSLKHLTQQNILVPEFPRNNVTALAVRPKNYNLLFL